MPDLENRLRTYDIQHIEATTFAKPTLPDADVAYAIHETVIGPMVLATAGEYIVASSFADEATATDRLARTISPRVLRQPARLDAVRRELDEFLAGRRTSFDIPVALTLASSSFQRQVLESLKTVTSYGKTTTYGRIAREIGHPDAARAVGAALRTNPCCVLLPCHRVVGKNGQLTGYTGGIEAKRRLLDLEALSND